MFYADMKKFCINFFQIISSKNKANCQQRSKKDEENIVNTDKKIKFK